MDGFFTKKEAGYTPVVKGKSLSCASCGLYKQASTQKMEPYGRGNKGIICIGEFPNQIDDRKGAPWQSKSGHMLKSTLAKFGIDLFEDCVSFNAVNCFSHEHAKPSNFQIDCCRSVIVQQAIKDEQPQLILLFGTAAIYSVIGDRWKKDLDGVVKWRGFCIPDHDLKAWVCPMYPPNFIHADDKNKAARKVWEDDLQNALSHLDKKLPHYEEPIIEVLDSDRDLSELKSISSLSTDMIAFDYETTGLKPHAQGHEIICASIATSTKHAFVFTMYDRSRADLRPFIKLLRDGRIGKMAHNMKFEDNWTNVILETPVNGWLWDSMVAAHILDNRPGITGLKFQTYVQLGVVDYSSSIAPYLRSVEKGGNAFNKIHELLKTKQSRLDLLTYCALDSIYEFRIARIQQDLMNYDFLPF